MRNYMARAALGILLATVATGSLAEESVRTMPVFTSSAASEAESYLAVSAHELERMLAAMDAFGKDRKNLQKAMSLMQAVKSFDAKTAAAYEQARPALAGAPDVLAAVEALRSDQASLARRLMNAEPSEFDAILAVTDRLAKVAQEAIAKIKLTSQASVGSEPGSQPRA